MSINKKIKLAALLCALGATGVSYAQEDKSVEVVHWWTSGGEAAALKILKDDVVKRGFIWKDSAIAGGGEPPPAKLRSRAASGNSPDAMQMLGFTITDYAEEGLLGNVDAVANKEGWDKVVPLPLQKFSKHKGKWVAAPVNIHRTNWIWANKAIFDELKLPVPKTFDALVAHAEKIRKAGYIPLAHGGQPWQEAIIFDSAVMSAGGPKFYKQAMVDLDPVALGSKTMEQAFAQMQKLRTMVDPNFPGRNWNVATSMVYHKKAAMQIMGDWAKGEFAKGNMKPNVDYLCFQYPGTDGTFIFIADQFAILKGSDKRTEGQAEFASAVMDKGFQEKFNMVKGSVPARTDVSMDRFDDCGKKSMSDLKQALKAGTMVGSYAQGHAMPGPVKTAVTDVVSKFFNSDKSPAEATKQLVAAVKNSK
ncbi:ABC transporter substrate-binding protein [Massilia glaciei]|uniref:Probable sugar-binding periplasmic protein n=1 Tax=Massilia glaciei TaxID=1524097 RepID=A0A2U2I7E8_9BURK|nr:ABC transporter substrate-binding protein [Massilia glaciei]PWF55666.1 carbohydrate ABC transporter substrate-binding protein [Massilia glaciei]